MKSYNVLTNLLSLSLSLSLTMACACGDAGEDDNNSANNTNNNSTNNTNNNTANNTNNNTNNNTANNTNNTTQATCDTACVNYVAKCSSEGITVEQCKTLCGTQIKATQYACLTKAATCDATNLCSTNTNNNQNNPNDNLGAECAANEECDSKYCRFPAGALEGKCAVNDFGSMCKKGMGGDDCTYGACVVAGDGSSDFGYCTTTCDDGFGCPFGWSCKELANTTSKYCVQD